MVSLPTGSDELIYIQTDKVSVTIKGPASHPNFQGVEHQSNDSCLQISCDDEYQLSLKRDEILGPIMQYRVDNELPMFVSSNRNMKELQKHLSETNNTVDEIKGRALIERFKFLMKEYELVDKDFRN